MSEEEGHSVMATGPSSGKVLRRAERRETGNGLIAYILSGTGVKHLTEEEAKAKAL